MKHLQNELDFTESPASDHLSCSVLEWVARTYETMEEWKAKAKDVFFSSNGDSNLSRNRVASIVRSHFLETPPKPENVQRWKTGFEEIEAIHVLPPKVSASNSAYVDWLYIADYLLLACASPTEQIDEENQRRETEFQNALGSYKIRSIVHDACGKMRNDTTISDNEILVDVQKENPKASMANIKEARRLEKGKVLHNAPKEPIPAEPMLRYTPLYF